MTEQEQALWIAVCTAMVHNGAEGKDAALSATDAVYAFRDAQKLLAEHP